MKKNNNSNVKSKSEAKKNKNRVAHSPTSSGDGRGRPVAVVKFPKTRFTVASLSEKNNVSIITSSKRVKEAIEKKFVKMVDKEQGAKGQPLRIYAVTPLGQKRLLAKAAK